MSNNENLPMADDPAKAQAIAVPRASVPEPIEASWSNVPAWIEPPQPPSLNFALYLHGLRRHWLLASGVGLLCALVILPVMWLLAWPAEYKAVAYLTVLPSEPTVAFSNPERQMADQRSYEVYKATQLRTMTTPLVLTAALGKRIEVDGRPYEVKSLSAVDRKDPVAWLQKELHVSYPGDGQLLEVSFRYSDPVEATVVVRAVVAAFYTEVVEREQNERRTRLALLNKAYDEKAHDVRESMNVLSSTAKDLKASDKQGLSIAQTNALDLANRVQTEYYQAQRELRRAQGELNSAQALQQTTQTSEVGFDLVEPMVRSDPMARQLSDQLVMAQRMWDYTSVNTNPKSRSKHTERYEQDLQMLQQQYNALTNRFKEEIRAGQLRKIGELVTQKLAEVSYWEGVVAVLEKDQEAKQKTAEDIAGGSVEIEVRRRDIDNLNLVKNDLDRQKQQLNIELNYGTRIQRFPDAPVPESEYNLPLRATVYVLAMLAGLCLPVIAIVLWDTRAQRINSSADVAKTLGWRVLGTVPKIPERVISRLGSSTSQRHQNWHLCLTEAVDGITARLLRKGEMENTRVILVSSAMPGEGKTTLATHLAMSFARNGRSTVLVDFDLRRPALDGVFGLPLAPGLSEVLRGETELDETIHETDTDQLSVVSAGQWDRRALAALAGGAAEGPFQKLRDKYDFVVVDTAPILPVADTRFLLRHADTVLLAVFRDLSQAPKVEAAGEILKAFGVNALEAVVTGSSERVRDKDLGYEPSLIA